MATIILQTEVQARIDALTYPIEATVLLQNAVDTVGLGLDLTNIIAVLDSSTSAITSGTPEDDVTALNAASLALGVTTKPDAGGGGSGIFINGVMPLNNFVDVYSSGGEVWLKSGVVSTDVDTYPDARVIEDVVYTGEDYDLSGEMSTPGGICWDGTHFWIVGGPVDAVFQYTSNGTYTGTSFDVSREEGVPTGIAWDGTHFWVVGTDSDAAHQYTSAGVYTGTSFDVSGQLSNPVDITWDGTHLWVLSSSTGAFQYTTGGTYTGTKFVTNSVSSSGFSGITWDGSGFWLCNSSSKLVFKFSTAGEYTENSFSTNEEDSVPLGLCWKEGYLWMVGSQWDKLYAYAVTKTIGLSEAKTDTSTDLPIYTRIK